MDGRFMCFTGEWSHRALYSPIVNDINIDCVTWKLTTHLFRIFNYRPTKFVYKINISINKSDTFMRASLYVKIQ